MSFIGDRLRAEGERQAFARSSGVEGDPVDLRGGEFGVGGNGVVTPGQELEVGGLNEFVRNQNRFRQIDQSIVNTANQVGLQDAVAKSRENARAQFKVAEGVSERRTRGLGIQLSKRQRRSRGRQFNLGRAVAEEGASSGVRRNFRRLGTAAATAAGGLEDSLRELESASNIGLSNAAGQERLRAENERANKKEARNSLISNVVGGGLALLSLSDETMKHSKRPAVQDGSLLERLKQVRVEKWKYVNEDTDHIGPYAQEFNDTFGVGKDDNKMINLVDAVGVLMGSIKELDAKVSANA